MLVDFPKQHINVLGSGLIKGQERVVIAIHVLFNKTQDLEKENFMDKIDFPVSTLRICIDEMTEGDSSELFGRISGVGVEKVHRFANSYELFLKIDNILDVIGRPQASREARTFSKEFRPRTNGYKGNPPRYHSVDEIRSMLGKIKTRDVYFVSRMYCTWQGFMKDADGRRIGKFDSDLDFLALLLTDQNIGGDITDA